MKRKSLRTYQSYSPSPRSAKQISDPLAQTATKKAFRRKIKETLKTMKSRSRLKKTGD